MSDPEAGADALSEEYYHAREAELADRVGPKRFAHSRGVAATAGRLAEAYGLDAAAARLAGILHDWDKAYDDPAILARAAELGVVADAELMGLPRLLHGLTAAAALGQEHPEIPGEVLSAVERHTIGAADMQPLDMVVYIADAIEPGRMGEEAEELRALVGKVDLRDLYVRTYAHLMSGMLDRRKRLYSKTVDFWNAYMDAEGGYRADAAADPMPGPDARKDGQRHDR